MLINITKQNKEWLNNMIAIGTRSKRERPQLLLSVQYADKPRDVPSRAKIQKWTLAALRAPAEITLRIVDEAEGRKLNRNFRRKDYATNVLTFVYSDMPLLRGDIVLCAPVVTREAEEQNISAEAHYAHLVVHALLHLQGYDHVSDRDAVVMEGLESKLVTGLGYADPYPDEPHN